MRMLVAYSMLVLPLAACGARVQTAPAVPPATAPAPVQEVLQAPQAAAPGSLQAVLTLTRHHWLLQDARDAAGKRIDALFVRADKPLQLDFNASMVSVGNACNTLSAHQTATADTLDIEPMATTLMACPDAALMALDREVGKRLQGRLGMRFGEGDSPSLTLTDAAGDVLVFSGRLPEAK